jgi:hypothetical protein
MAAGTIATPGARWNGCSNDGALVDPRALARVGALLLLWPDGLGLTRAALAAAFQCRAAQLAFGPK